MIYPHKPFYVVSGFTPPIEYQLGGFGFCVGIDMGLAKKALERKLPDEGFDRMQEIGKKIIVSSGLAKKDEHIYPPYKFAESKEGYNLLLRFCDVPGNACSLGLDGDWLYKFERFDKYDGELLLEYVPHNVDSIHQAYALLSLWTNWADSVFATCGERIK